MDLRLHLEPALQDRLLLFGDLYLVLAIVVVYQARAPAPVPTIGSGGFIFGAPVPAPAPTPGSGGFIFGAPAPAPESTNDREPTNGRKKSSVQEEKVSFDSAQPFLNNAQLEAVLTDSFAYLSIYLSIFYIINIGGQQQ